MTDLLKPMKLDPQDLEKIVQLTLEHYNQRAEEFWKGTRDHDVGRNIAALLQYIDSKAPFTILDFGCGPGRDLKVFAELGHICDRFGRRCALCRNGARPQRLRRMAAGFSQARSAG